jgi:hypothetical protein
MNFLKLLEKPMKYLEKPETLGDNLLDSREQIWLVLDYPIVLKSTVKP